MGDIFRNKFFIILLIVAFVLTLSAMILNVSGRGSVVTDVTNIIVMPFQKFADIVKESLSGFRAYWTKFNYYKERVEVLEAEVARLEVENEDARALQEQNDTLMEFFELKKERMDFKFQPARVIYSESGNFLSVLTINKGSFHKIEKDMSVIADNGTDKVIIGYISEVDYATSKVVLFTRTSESIGAYIKRTGEIGVVEGDFELEKRGMCRIAYLSKETDLQVGDKIYSSGYGGIYPENLYIGKVTEVIYDQLSQTPTGYIEPAINFYEVKDVMIILKFNRDFY